MASSQGMQAAVAAMVKSYNDQLAAKDVIIAGLQANSGALAAQVDADDIALVQANTPPDPAAAPAPAPAA